MAFTYYVNGMGLAGSEGFPKGLVTTTTRQCSLAWASLKTSPETARPFSAAASEPSMSACRATTSTTLPPTPPFAYNPGEQRRTSLGPSNELGRAGTDVAARRPIFAAGVKNLSPTYQAPAVAQFSLGMQHEI